MRQQLLTATITIFATSFKIIFDLLYHRQVKQIRFMAGPLCRQLGILMWFVTIKRHRNLQLRNHSFKVFIFLGGFTDHLVISKLLHKVVDFDAFPTLLFQFTSSRL